MMKINEAIDFLKSLLNKTNEKSEIKVYGKFIGMLTDLKNKDLTETQLQSIEKELAALNLNTKTENQKKYIRKKLAAFEKYLRDQYSFVSEGFYTAMGVSLGLSFGAGLGLTIGTSIEAGVGTSIGLSMGAGIGMTFGIIIGATKDAEAKKQGRVLKTKLD